MACLNSEESGEESEDEQEQGLKQAETCGRQWGPLWMIAFWELLICVLLLGAFVQLRGVKIVIVLLITSGLHLCNQIVLSFVDFTGVNSILESLEEGMEDEATANVLKSLCSLPPKITVTAEAYTKEGKKVEVIDHRVAAEFQYASWQDVSERVAGLEKHCCHTVAAIEVVATFKSFDQFTANSFMQLKQSLEDVCMQYRTSNGNIRFKEKITVQHPDYPVIGSRVFATLSPGAKTPCWMTPCFYKFCRFLFPGLGSLYRIAFFASITNLRYTIVKEVCTARQRGAGWK